MLCLRRVLVLPLNEKSGVLDTNLNNKYHPSITIRKLYYLLFVLPPSKLQKKYYRFVFTFQANSRERRHIIAFLEVGKESWMP